MKHVSGYVPPELRRDLPDGPGCREKRGADQTQQCRPPAPHPAPHTACPLAARHVPLLLRLSQEHAARLLPVPNPSSSLAFRCCRRPTEPPQDWRRQHPLRKVVPNGDGPATSSRVVPYSPVEERPFRRAIYTLYGAALELSAGQSLPYPLPGDANRTEVTPLPGHLVKHMHLRTTCLLSAFDAVCPLVRPS
jgi:hypothetical protein